MAKSERNAGFTYDSDDELIARSFAKSVKSNFPGELQGPLVSRNGEKPDLPPDALEIIGHLDKEFAEKERILRIQLQDAETKNHSLVDMIDTLRERVSRYRVDVERANQLADKCALFEACNVTQGERIADLESSLRVAKRTETALRERIRKLERR